MDLIDDLGNDLAFAFLIERRHLNRLDSREVLNLIGKVKEILQPVSVAELDADRKSEDSLNTASAK